MNELIIFQIQEFVLVIDFENFVIHNFEIYNVVYFDLGIYINLF